MEFLKKNKIAILFISIFIWNILVFNQHIVEDKVLNYVDIKLVTPVENLSSFSEYLTLMKTSTILDFQPIRDLSFYLNHLFNKLLGVSGYHFFNLIFYMILLVVFGKLLKILNIKDEYIFLGIALLAFHPILISSVGWISARKHSLTSIFILLAIISILKKKEVTIKSIIFYFLSIFTHPITLLFPAWILVLFYLKQIKKLTYKFIILGFVSILGLYANYWKVLSLGHGNTEKVAGRDAFDVLSMGILNMMVQSIRH